MIRVRIAPSPTGVPHIGNTRTALFNWLFAKKHRGEFIVRIEDTDQKRLVPKSLDKILEILEWLNLNWDEGPKRNGQFGPYVQSQRLDIYQKHAQELVNKGFAYYCFCSPERLKQMRQEQQERSLAPKYDRLCLNLTEEEINEKIEKGEKCVVRFRMPDTGVTSWTDLIRDEISFENKNLDDYVLLKSDGYPTYHLGVVIDDYLMKITHILRGAEWISSTPKHILLYRAFGWDLPKFAHLPMILGPDKAKLSKRHGAQSILDYRDQGYLKEALLNAMFLWGFHPQEDREIFTLSEMISEFDLSRVQKGNAIADLKKLDWFNSYYVKNLSDDELGGQILKFYTNKEPRIIDQASKICQLLPLVWERMKTLRDFWELTDFIFKDEIKVKWELIKKSINQEINKPKIGDTLSELRKNLVELDQWQADGIEECLRKWAQENNWSSKDLFMMLRILITGKKISPPLFESMEVLGKERTLERLNKFS